MINYKPGDNDLINKTLWAISVIFNRCAHLPSDLMIKFIE